MSWMLEVVPKGLVGSKCQVGSPSPNPGNKGSFGHVSNICNEWGKVALDAAKGVRHEGALRGRLFYWFADDVKTVVHKAILNDTMEGFLEVPEFWTG